MTRPLLLAVLTALALAGCSRSENTSKPAAPATGASASAAASAPAGGPSKPAATVYVPAISEAEQAKAANIARAAIEKYKLTSLPQECLSFLADQEDAAHYSVEVLENHTPACGGDPATAPRVVTLLIDKKTSALQKDDPTTGEYVPLK